MRWAAHLSFCEDKMASNGRYSKAPPDKANELFEKLLATSDGAAKTR